MSCKLEDVSAIGTATTYWSIDEEGEPVDEQSVTTSDFADEFYCNGCGEHFTGFVQVTEHLNATA